MIFKDVSKFKRLIILCLAGLVGIIILLGLWLNFGFGMPPDKVFFKASFIEFYKEYEFYIRYRRDEVDKTQSVWENFTLLAESWDDKNERSADL
jgi:hypothetical protein